MAYASGRRNVVPDPENPQAQAVCDRCGAWYRHADLQFQYDWRGNQLTNLYLLVCPRCTDVPFQLNRPVILPPDPEPVLNARVEPFAADEGAAPPNIPVVQLVPD